MELDLIPLSNRSDIKSTYGIYRHCMYLPTEEKFIKKVDAFLGNDSVKVFACLYRNETKGVMAISFTEPHKAEIIGIAVEETLRGKGIASYMIRQLAEQYGLLSVYAETDGDAVDFYRKNGFCITEFSETYDAETVVRYQCKLLK